MYTHLCNRPLHELIAEAHIKKSIPSIGARNMSFVSRLFLEANSAKLFIEDEIQSSNCLNSQFTETSGSC